MNALRRAVDRDLDKVLAVVIRLFSVTSMAWLVMAVPFRGESTPIPWMMPQALSRNKKICYLIGNGFQGSVAHRIQHRRARSNIQ
jgi:hypothetical protein